MKEYPYYFVHEIDKGDEVFEWIVYEVRGPVWRRWMAYCTSKEDADRICSALQSTVSVRYLESDFSGYPQ